MRKTIKQPAAVSLCYEDYFYLRRQPHPMSVVVTFLTSLCPASICPCDSAAQGIFCLLKGVREKESGKRSQGICA